jgi:hypothetical protein
MEDIQLWRRKSSQPKLSVSCRISVHGFLSGKKRILNRHNTSGSVLERIIRNLKFLFGKYVEPIFKI